MDNTKRKKKLPIAHLANEFALNGKVDFTNAREWIIFLYLVAQLDPKNQDELPPEAIIPLSDLKKVLSKNNNRSGGLYEEIRKATKRMAKVVCEFSTEVLIEGKTLPLYVPIFSAIGAKKSEEGGIYISYEFNEKMTPLLLGFRRNFLNIQLPKTIASAHAIRFLLYAKAERDRRKKEGQETIIQFDIDELKKLLRIEGKYSSFKNFRVRVLEPIQDGINQSGILEMPNIEYIRSGRKITKIKFYIKDAATTKEMNTSISLLPEDDTELNREIEQLTFSQKKAFDFLTDNGVYPKIVIHSILKKMPAEICNGYEDFFAEEIYEIVKEKSRAKDAKSRAAVLVNWVKQGIFNDDQFSRIIETVYARKKKLSQEKRDNRSIAKKMTAQEFTDWYRSKVN